jgi:carotenoid cleavage dioxygenase
MSDKPFYLQGNFAPVTEEVTATDLAVEGEIPSALRGRFFRNGPNPKSGTSAHWFVGDGMLHGVELRDGRASWYRNRWVRTKALEGAGDFVRADGTVDRTIGVANTHVIGHAGKILALVETSFPTEVTETLDTVGPYDYDGRLSTGMTAHPKICPTTGELHFFGYGFFPPYLVYSVADADGALVHHEEIDVPGPTMMHDFNITASHVVFMDLPVVFDLELAMSGDAGMPYRWDASYGARLGVMPRRGSNADVRWHEIDPCYVFHPMNAYDDGDDIVLDVLRYDTLWDVSRDEFGPACLYQWRISASGAVKGEPADDRSSEFPRVNPAHVGLPYRYGYATLSDVRDGVDLVGLVKYDRERGTSVAHDPGPGRRPAEGVFVADPEGRAEDDGWVMTFVYDAARDGSDFVILDARDFAAPPVAVVPLPQRVPFGFHGSWIPDS